MSAPTFHHRAPLRVLHGFYGCPRCYLNCALFLSQDLVITVTPLNGDPDLYVSLTSETPGPNNYNISSAIYRGDAITIRHTDPVSFVLRSLSC